MQTKYVYRYGYIDIGIDTFNTLNIYLCMYVYLFSSSVGFLMVVLMYFLFFSFLHVSIYEYSIDAF